MKTKFVSEKVSQKSWSAKKISVPPKLARKNTILEKNSFITPLFYSVRISHASDNTTIQNIGGDGCMGRPPPQILGGPSPHSPLGLRPCTRGPKRKLYAERSRVAYKTANLNFSIYSLFYCLWFDIVAIRAVSDCIKLQICLRSLNSFIKSLSFRRRFLCFVTASRAG